MYSSYSFMTSILDGGEWSASRPGCALPRGERNPSTHWTGGWVDTRDGLDTEVTEKSVASAGDRTSIVRSVVRHYTDKATTTPHVHTYSNKNVKYHCMISFFTFTVRSRNQFASYNDSYTQTPPAKDFYRNVVIS
jgi:hypothetical protein